MMVVIIFTTSKITEIGANVRSMIHLPKSVLSLFRITTHNSKTNYYN